MEKERLQPQGQPDYDDLLRQYGEAMLRIGQLEAQVERLTGEPQGRTGPTTPHVADEGGARSDPADLAQDEHPTNAEMGQLRLQVASLANQLSQTEEKLQQAEGHRARRRHRVDDRRARWTKLARRLGLRRSDRSERRGKRSRQRGETQ